MKTISVYIKECSDLGYISKKDREYSYAFRKLYTNYDKIDDKLHINYMKKKFKLTDIEYRSLKSDVLNKIEQTKTNKIEKECRIIDLEQDIKEIKEKEIKDGKSNKSIRSKFKKRQTIQRLEKVLPQNITFGGKQNFRELVKLHNNIKVISKEKDQVKRNNLLEENKIKIVEKTKEWKADRILQCYNLGEANQIGNRFFDFDFKNNTIIYKPKKDTKIHIKFNCSKAYKKELIDIQKLVDDKIISLTVSMSDRKVCISFDNEIVSSYYIDKTERRKEVKEINSNEYTSKDEKKELIAAIYKRYYEDLRKQKLIGKVSNRYMAIDTNPYYIGYCIADKGTDGIEKIIEKGVINLIGLNEKLKLSSEHPLVKKQNNKRVYEINNVYKELFNIAKHYKAAYFIGEDINNIGRNESLGNKESNHQVKNVWHRGIGNWQIQKRCVMYGIEFIPIIPAYTSFIGNLMYDYFDATNAAIEICRRGMSKFEKGLFYPQITGTIFDTMKGLIESQNIQLKPRDAQIFKDCQKWGELFKVASNSAIRWRWDWSKVERPNTIFSLNSVKSKVKIVRFTD